MGSFSWYTSDTKRAILIDNPFPVYVLFPDGELLLEEEYNGYGKFGGHDIYNLVADWNRKYLSENPDFEIAQERKIWHENTETYIFVPTTPVSAFYWYSEYANLQNTPKDIEAKMKDAMPFWEYREIGIDIAGTDSRNTILPYPIKLVEHPIFYSAVAASNNDPHQGWGYRERFEGDDYIEDFEEDFE